MNDCRIPIIVFTVLFGACSRSADSSNQQAAPEVNITTPTAAPTTPAPDPNNPAEVQRRFAEKISADIKRAEPDLKKPLTQKYSDGVHTYFAEYAGKFDYDITKTDSIVTPYLGTVSWSIRWYHNGVVIDQHVTLDARYAYQGGRWVIKDLSRNFGGEKVPGDGIFFIFSIDRPEITVRLTKRCSQPLAGVPFRFTL
jgi:hypothetical protein